MQATALCTTPNLSTASFGSTRRRWPTLDDINVPPMDIQGHSLTPAHFPVLQHSGRLERQVLIPLPNRPPSATPSHDWSRPVSFAANNFPDWSPGHPKSVSGLLLRPRQSCYKAPPLLFSCLGEPSPRVRPGTRHSVYRPHTVPTNGRPVTPYATWTTTNSTYGLDLPGQRLQP